MSHSLAYGMMRDLYSQLPYVRQRTESERRRMIERALRKDGTLVCRYSDSSRTVRIWYVAFAFPEKTESLLGWEYVR